MRASGGAVALTPPTASRSSEFGRWLWRLCRLALLAAVLWFIARFVTANLEAMRAHPFAPRWGWIGTAIAALLAAQFVNALVFRVLLAGDPAPAGTARAYALLTAPGLARYVPGKLAVMVGTAWVFESLGYPRQRGIWLLLYTQVALLAGGFLASTPYALLASGEHPAVAWLRWAPLLALPGLPLLHPGLWDRFAGTASRVLGLGPPQGAVVAHAAVPSLLLGTLGMALSGAGFAALVAGITGWPGAAAAGAAAGAYPLAQCVGFLAFLAPAGMGVREGVLMIALAPILGADVAIVASLTARLLQVAVDALGAVLGLALVRRERRRARGGGP